MGSITWLSIRYFCNATLSGGSRRGQGQEPADRRHGGGRFRQGHAGLQGRDEEARGKEDTTDHISNHRKKNRGNPVSPACVVQSVAANN